MTRKSLRCENCYQAYRLTTTEMLKKKLHYSEKKKKKKNRANDRELLIDNDNVQNDKD